MEFKDFGKIPRLFREVIVTEKLDGTNACVVVEEDGTVAAQSRNRIITPETDNYGFAKWVLAHAGQLRELGPGHHFGEWWGLGINRGYGLEEKRFSLFNVSRWGDARPACCGVVPVVYTGVGLDSCVRAALEELKLSGSRAVPGYPNPEGVVAFHTAGNLLFKATLDNDGVPKGKVKDERPS